MSAAGPTGRCGAGWLALSLLLAGGCSDEPWNDPHRTPAAGERVIYSSFEERPKRELLKTGAVDLAMAWDPATAGLACNVVALKVLKGEEITEGMDLGVPGYEKIQLVKGVNGVPVIYGAAWIKMDANTVDDYPF